MNLERTFFSFKLNCFGIFFTSSVWLGTVGLHAGGLLDEQPLGVLPGPGGQAVVGGAAAQQHQHHHHPHPPRSCKQNTGKLASKN